MCSFPIIPENFLSVSFFSVRNGQTEIFLKEFLCSILSCILSRDAVLFICIFGNAFYSMSQCQFKAHFLFPFTIQVTISILKSFLYAIVQINLWGTDKSCLRELQKLMTIAAPS